jgi:hypothetical protein
MTIDECGISAIARTACVVVLALASFVADGAAQAAPANHDCSAADNRTWVQGDGECLYIHTFDRDKTVAAPLLLEATRVDPTPTLTTTSRLSPGRCAD